MLIDAGLEDEPTHTQLLRGSLEAGKHRPSDSLASLIGFDVHPLRLGSLRVKEADGSAPNRPVAVTRDEKRAVASCEMFGCEVRPEALLPRVELSEARVQLRDQSSCVVGVEGFRANREVEVAHFQRIGCATRRAPAAALPPSVELLWNSITGSRDRPVP